MHTAWPNRRCASSAARAPALMRGSTSGHQVMPPPADVRIADDKVFLLSDNRLLPYDSRDFGLVDRDSCTETVVFRLFSKDGYFDADRRFMFIH